MTSASHGFATRILAMVLAGLLLCPALPSQQSDYIFHAQTDLVLVNVTVRDKNGNFVRNLNPGDFTLLEDNKPQKIVSFDIENTDAMPSQDVVARKPLTGEAAKPAGPDSLATTAHEFKDRRLIVLFFDLSAMEPDEIDRAIAAAVDYVDTQMAPADLVAIVSLGSSLVVNQDFTTDHDLLKRELLAFNTGSGQGFEEGSTGSTEGTPDTAQPFTVNDTEYNIFNTDRRLEALRSVVRTAGLCPAEKIADLFLERHGSDRD